MKKRIPVDIQFLMESVLGESPDRVIFKNEDGDDDDVWWDQSYLDPYTFFAFDTFSAMLDGGMHRQIITKLRRLFDTPDNEVDAAIKNLKEYGLLVSDFDAARVEINNPATDIGKFFDELGGKSDDVFRAVLDDGRYRSELGVCGRLWIDPKIMSFWTKRSAVINNYSKLEKMFKHFSRELGSIDSYSIDWVERNNDPNSPLTPSSSLKTSGAVQPKAPEISDEQLLLLLQKAHTLSPEKKQKVLRVLGARNYKAADIASKLGMTVAEFNHIMNINENGETS